MGWCRDAGMQNVAGQKAHFCHIWKVRRGSQLPVTGDMGTELDLYSELALVSSANKL